MGGAIVGASISILVGIACLVIGIFNIKGEATDVKADLTDGRYINIINGQSVDVRDGIIDSEIIKRNDGVIEIIK